MKRVCVVVALLCLAGCSKSGNPTSPTNTTSSPAGTASILFAGIVPIGACPNFTVCDSAQAIRPNANGLYEIRAFGNYVYLVFNNPRVPGRTVEITRRAAFCSPEVQRAWFGEADAGTPAQYGVVMSLSIVNTNVADKVIYLEAVESGPGLSTPNVMKLEFPVQFIG